MNSKAFVLFITISSAIVIFPPLAQSQRAVSNIYGPPIFEDPNISRYFQQQHEVVERLKSEVRDLQQQVRDLQSARIRDFDDELERLKRIQRQINPALPR